jgi:hypothetical protein
MISLLQRVSSARLAGRQLKISRRLGVSPAPAGLNGPAIMIVPSWGCERVSPMPATGRGNQCRWVSVSADDFLMKASPRSCGPALTGIRTVNGL